MTAPVLLLLWEQLVRKPPTRARRTARPRHKRNRLPRVEPADGGREIAEFVAAAVDAVVLPQEEEKPPGREQAGPQVPSGMAGKL